jgi:Lrp/AsnC family transcriptional regulator for asnA, asnC and gidA
MRPKASGEIGGTGRAERGAVSRGVPLDEVDRGLIEMLQTDGRASFRRIASRLGVSEATVRARFKRLCAADVLQVVGITNPLGMGFEVMAMVAAKVQGPPRAIADEITGWREASYVVVTTGQFDILAEFVCRDWRHFLDLVGRVRATPGVISTETFLYLDLCKQLFDWGTARAQEGENAPGNGTTGVN